MLAMAGRRIEPVTREITATLENLQAAQDVCTTFLDACAQQAACEEWFQRHDLGHVQLLDCARNMPTAFTVRAIATRYGFSISGARRGLEDLVARGLLSRSSCKKKGYVTYFYTVVEQSDAF